LTRTRRFGLLAMLVGLGLAAPAAAYAAPTLVSLTFDDARADQTVLNTVLGTRAMKGTFYVNSGFIGGSGSLSWGDLNTLAAGGHEIAGHTINHPDLTQLSASEVEHEVCDDRAALSARGFIVPSFAYPFGNGHESPTVRSVIQGCGYTSARGYWGLQRLDNAFSAPLAETVPPRDPWWLRSPCCIKDDTTLAQLQGAVTRVENSGGGWVILVFHSICDRCDPWGYSTPQSLLENFLDWLGPRAVQGTAVKTVAQVMTGDSQAPSTSVLCNSAACSTGWYTDPVSVSLSATDTGGSGTAVVRYTLDGSEPTPASPAYSAPLSVSATTTVKYRAWDNASNVETAGSQLVQIDTIAPTSSISCDGAPCSSSSYAGPVTVTLAATDNAGGSGVSVLRYTLDGSEPTATSTAYAGPFSVSATTTVKYGAWDVAGNVEATKNQAIQIAQAPPADTTPPVSSIACNSAACSSAWYGVPVTVSLSAADGDSGVAAIRYTLDGSEPTASSSQYIDPFTVSATRTVKFRAWDNAGNVEATNSQLVQIDTQAPTVAITSPTNGSTVKGNVKVTATAADAGSGVVSVSFYANGTLIATKVGAPFFINWQTNKLPRGQYVLTAVAVDAAGNTTTSAAVTVNA
jgi:peptidoglycan/xylan/chitin deacetylase (PgdA/CDA1 family)